MKNWIPDIFPYINLRLNGFQSREYKTRFGTLHYYEKQVQNSRGTLVFVHGIGASAGYFDRVMIPLSREGFSVFAVDLPSHGKSEDFPGLNPESFYGAVFEWASKILPEKFALIGNSLGGGLSLRLGIEYTDRVTHLILASPAGGFEKPEDWDEFKQVLSLNSYKDSWKFLKRVLHRPPIYFPFLCRPFLRSMNQPGVRSLVSKTRHQDFLLEPKNLDQIPLLLIWGEEEKLFSVKHLDVFAKKLPAKAKLDRPSGIGHCPHLDNPRWFRKRILQFVQQSS